MSHPVTLLPWYQNGTLSDAERAEVSAHLESCADCRAELESLGDVRKQVHAAFESDAVPSPAARRRVMENIARASSAAAEPAAARESASARAPARARPRDVARPNPFGEALRSLFAMKWAPAAAAVLIVLQAGMLTWTMRAGEPPQTAVTPPSTGLQPPSDGVASRGGEGLRIPTAKLRVVFAGTATESQIRALLAEVKGRIVDGPGADGAYTVEVLASDAARAAAKAGMMRERADLVQSAEPLAP